MSDSPFNRKTPKTKKRKEGKKGGTLEGVKQLRAFQFIPFSRELQLLSLLLDHSLTRIRDADLMENQLSEFVPVIVLIPKSTVTGRTILSKISAQSLKQKSKTSKLLRQLRKTALLYKRASTEGEAVFGDAAVNFSTMEAWRNGEPVTLTAMEFKILGYMIRNERRAIPRNELLNQVWGYESYPRTRTVDNHILRLRQKLEREPSRPVHFRTVRGVGYKFLSHRDQV